VISTNQGDSVIASPRSWGEAIWIFRLPSELY